MNYTSSVKHYYLLKYLPWIGCSIFIVFGILTYFQEEDIESTLYQIIFGLIFGILAAYLYPKASIVRMNYKGVWVQQASKETFYNWEQIKFIKQVPFIVPPLYRIKFQDVHEEDIVFIVNDGYIFLVAMTKDMSAMGKFIKQKNHELAIGMYK